MYEYGSPDLRTQALTAAYTEQLPVLAEHNTLEPMYTMEQLMGQEVEIDTRHGIPPTEQVDLGIQLREGDTQVRVIGLLGIPGARHSSPGESALGIGYAAIISESHGYSGPTKLALQGLTLDASSKPHVVEAAGAKRVYLPPTGTVVIGRNATSDRGPVISAVDLWGGTGYGGGTSRENTEIRTDAGEMFVKDLGSKAGTFVSPEAVIRRPANAHERHTIRYAGQAGAQALKQSVITP